MTYLLSFAVSIFDKDSLDIPVRDAVYLECEDVLLSSLNGISQDNLLVSHYPRLIQWISNYLLDALSDNDCNGAPIKMIIEEDGIILNLED